MMKVLSFTIAAFLVAGLVSAHADTITVTNRGSVFTIEMASEGDRTVTDLEQAPVLPELKVLRNAQIGKDLDVLGDLTVTGNSPVVNAAGTSGYLDLAGTALNFVTTATNGVALTPYITNAVVADVSSQP